MFFTETPIQRVIRSGFPILLGCVLGTTAPKVAAIGLSDIQVESFLGEPFSATVRILGDDAKDTHADCFTAQPLTDSQNHDLPPLVGIKIEFKRPQGSNTPFLQLRTQQPVNEPMARIAVQAGCGTSLVREYVAMLSPRIYEESLISAPPAALPAATKPSVEQAEAQFLPEAKNSAGMTPTPAPAASKSPTTSKVSAAQSEAKAQVAAPTKDRSVRPSAKAPRPAPTAKTETDRLVIAPLNAGPITAPASSQKKINLTSSKLAAAEMEIGALKSELERSEETRQKEIQALQALEVHIISLQKEMADLKLQIRHKEELERKILAQASQSKLTLFSNDSAEKSIGTPTEFFWMLIIAGGIGGLSAFGTYSALKRQKTDKWV